VNSLEILYAIRKDKEMSHIQTGQPHFRGRPLRDWLGATICRIVDDFPWMDHVEVVEERCDMEDMITNAMLSNPHVAELFVLECLKNGIIEEDYFEQDY
jgi:hypothetical protein